MWGKDEGGCGGEDKETKTEAEMDGLCKVYLREKELSGEGMQNRAVWTQPFTYIDPMKICGGRIRIYTIILLKSVCLSVDVRKLQVAILARSSREMLQTVRIV